MRFAAATLVLAFFVCQTSLSLLAQAAKAPLQQKQKAVAAEVKQRPIPFHGTISAVDSAARTITVGKRTFLLTAETKLYKGDKSVAGTLKDGVKGGRVTGSYIKSSEGKLLARSVYFKPSVAAGMETAGTQPASKQKPAGAKE